MAESVFIAQPVLGAGDFSGPAGAIVGNLVSFADGTGKLGADSGIAGADVVLDARTLTAGAGLTGGGDLSADRTFDVVANADGSIVVNADDIQVGILATDAQHGVRGGGTQHALAVASGAAGFISGADQQALDDLISGGPFLPLAGGTMSGAINMGAQSITNTALISSLGVLEIIPAAGFELRLSSGGETTRVLGDLVVDGTTTTVDSETVLIADNYLDLNVGYTTTSAETGGLVVNNLPRATADTVNGVYVAGIAATSNPTVVTTGAATFSVSDIIQFSGSTDNNGFYEVLSHAANLLTVRGVGLTSTVEDFSQNQFIAGASDGAAITKFRASVINAGIDGRWGQSVGDSTPLTFEAFATGGLAEVYEVGSNTVAITAADGTIALSAAADATDVLALSRSFAGAGEALTIDMATGTTGMGAHITMAAGSTGTAFRVDQDGSGIVAQFDRGVNTLFLIDGSGAVFLNADTGQNVAIRADGAGNTDIGTIGTGNALLTAAGTGDVIARATAGTVSIQSLAGAVDVDAIGGALSLDGDTVAIGTTVGDVTVDPAAGQNFVVTLSSSAIFNSATATADDAIVVNRSTGGAGGGISVSMATGTTGMGAHITMDAGSTGTALRVDQDGSGDALDVQGVGIQELRLDSTGEVFIDSDAATDLSVTAGANLLMVASSGNANLDATSGSVVIDAVSSGIVALQVGGNTKLAVALLGGVDITPSNLQDFTVTTTGGAVSSFNGPMEIIDSQAIDTLSINKSGAVAGDGLSVTMATTTTGIGAHITMDAGSTGTALRVDQDGSGFAIDIRGSGISSLSLDSSGIFDLQTATGSAATLRTGGTGLMRIFSGGTATIDSTTGNVELQDNGDPRWVSTQTGSIDITPGAGVDCTVTIAAGAGSFVVNALTGSTAVALHVLSDSGSTGIGLQVDQNGTGTGIHITMDAGSSAEGLRIDHDGSGDPIDVRGFGISSMALTGQGDFNVQTANTRAMTLRTGTTGVMRFFSGGTLTADSTLGNVEIQDNGDERWVSTQTGSIDITPGAGADLAVTLAAGAGSFVVSAPTGTTGSALSIVSDVGSTGDSLHIEQNGTGDVAEFNQGGSLRFLINAGGAVIVAAADGQNAIFRTGGAGDAILRAEGAGNALVAADGGGDAEVVSISGDVRLDAIGGQLTFDDVGNSGLTLSQTDDLVLTETSGVQTGTTSFIAAFNRLSERATVVQGELEGLHFENNAGTPDEIVDIDPGQCVDSTGVHYIDVGSTLTADNTVSGAGGLDTGTVAADTKYALFVIDDTAGVNAADALLSLSGTAPTMPAGYDVFRRVGWVRTDATSDFETFGQPKSEGRSRWVYFQREIQLQVAGTASAFAATSTVASDFTPVTATRQSFDIEATKLGGASVDARVEVVPDGWDQTAGAAFWKSTAGVGGTPDPTTLNTVVIPVVGGSTADVEYQVAPAGDASADIFLRGYEDTL